MSCDEMGSVHATHSCVVLWICIPVSMCGELSAPSEQFSRFRVQRLGVRCDAPAMYLNEKMF